METRLWAYELITMRYLVASQGLASKILAAREEGVRCLRTDYGDPRPKQEINFDI